MYEKNARCVKARSFIIILITVFLSTLVITSPVSADSEDITGFTMTVTEVRSLEISASSAFFVPGVRELLDGESSPQTWVASVSANVDWVLTIRGAESFWEGPWDKPVSDILWEYDGSGWLALSTEPVEIRSGGPSNQEAYPISVKVNLDIEQDIPGEYYYGYVVLELSSP